MTILVGLITGMISGATPILLAALGGAFTFYSGVFNIAMEGMMLTGAFFAVLGSYTFHSWVAGILLGIAASVVLAMIFILFALVLHADEFVTGIAINLFAVAATTYLLRQIFNVKGVFTSPDIVPIPRLDIPLLRDIPFLGQILSGQNLMVYITLAAVLVCAYVIFKTQFGLRLRAGGYNALSLDSSGVSSTKMRVWSLLICGVLCGLAGSFLSLGYVHLFVENMSAGRGWISMAAIILVNGNPWGVALVSLLFGFTDGLGLLLQSYNISAKFTSMAPYIATLIALYFYSVRTKRELLK